MHRRCWYCDGVMAAAVKAPKAESFVIGGLMNKEREAAANTDPVEGRR